MCLYQAKASSASASTISFLGEQEPHSCSRLFLFLSLYLPSCWMCSFPAWVVLLFRCGCGSMPVPSARCSSVLPKIHPLGNIGLREHLAGLTRPLFCSVFFLSCLEVAKLVPDQAANRGKKKGKKKSVLFLLINWAMEKGSVFHSVALGRPVFPSPYQFGNVLSRRCHETQGTGRHCHVCLCKIMTHFERSEYSFSCGGLGVFSSLNTDLIAGGCSLTSGFPGSSQEKWFFSLLTSVCVSLF